MCSFILLPFILYFDDTLQAPGFVLIHSCTGRGRCTTDSNVRVGGCSWQVLGMERLKAELQSRGLKCGGTLQERAARLFLLKTIPFENLPKKVLAAKSGGK